MGYDRVEILVKYHGEINAGQDGGAKEKMQQRISYDERKYYPIMCLKILRVLKSRGSMFP